MPNNPGLFGTLGDKTCVKYARPYSRAGSSTILDKGLTTLTALSSSSDVLAMHSCWFSMLYTKRIKSWLTRSGGDNRRRIHGGEWIAET